MTSGMASKLTIKIADIIISAVAEDGDGGFELSEVYRRFVSRGQPTTELRVHYGVPPRIDLGEVVFDPEGPWRLHRRKGKVVIASVYASAQGPGLSKVAILTPDFRWGDVYTEPRGLLGSPQPYPLEYPLDRVLMINLLSQERGMVIHACGISEQGRGVIFAGSSGAGKSTLASLWEGQEGVVVLNDDRVIVRPKGGRLWVYGTPWHGDVQAASPLGVPLEKVFFLKHAERNSVTAKTGTEAAAMLLVCAFPTFWDAAGMQFTLHLCAKLSREVSCYELGFMPDESVLDFVRSMD